jgi:hypothetical protein
MTLAPWRSHLAAALHRNRSLRFARYLQLATVRVDGRPANRTVVFRGFLEETNCLKFVTDIRSQKVEEINLYPWGEICWYFPKTREQFRIAGKLILAGQNIQILSFVRGAASLGRSFLRLLGYNLLGHIRGKTKLLLVILNLFPQMRSSLWLISVCCCWNRKQWMYWSYEGNRRIGRFICGMR